ncbi:MAG: thiamine phosphate synthase [Pseudomonadota bacterium]|nr:thiamine phosphate synthase [Pseudomonadota bacterium]
MIVGITCGGDDLLGRVRAALAAGIDHVIVREAALPAGLAPIAEAWPHRLVLHARMPGAVALAAELPVRLHFASDVPPASGCASADSVRDPRSGSERGPARGFSVSAHSPEEVRRACAAGADWALLSPIWRSPSKPTDTRPPLGVGVLGVGGAVALGGVDPTRVALCRAAGALGVAGMGGIFGARDVAEAVNAWRSAWGAAGERSGNGSALGPDPPERA